MQKNANRTCITIHIRNTLIITSMNIIEIWDLVKLFDNKYVFVRDTYI